MSKEIILNTVKSTNPNYKKYKALVDDEDFERVSQYKWSIRKHRDIYYAYGFIDGKMIPLHQFIMKDKWIDHINRKGLDCRKSNLRKVTPSQNQRNRRANKNSTSKYKGVYWQKAGCKWRATIFVNNKLLSLGFFCNELDAALAYNKAAIKHFGEFARINQIDAGSL